MARTYPKFTTAELKTIKANEHKVTLKDLAKLMGTSYTNLSGRLKQNRVVFNPKITRTRSAMKEDLSMNKKVNEKGQALVTDAILAEWFDFSK